ncbi:BTAD domain-containing putative transcriptional regulator [Streptomyces sp. NPDC101118]|uniref:AfsR/SARP family transcriptional regulator n=1 Tax=Streptomyces sp. NPDC101118 TaxID=3366109 RepID=UPI003812BCF1
MDFRILGPVEARRGNTRIALSGSKVHTVLAALLLARGRVVSDARLSTLLWGWDPPATAGAQIYTYMSRLRKHLGEDVEIIRQPPGYLFAAHGSRIDLDRFERLEREGRSCLERGEYEKAGELLCRALELWRGPALANVTEYMLEVEREPLEEARNRALECRIEADLALGRHERITGELTGLVARFPTRERLRAQLMTALYRCGRQADALHAYHEGRKVLAEQLGVDPGTALGDTYKAVLTGELGLESPAPITTGARRPVVTPAMLPPDTDDFTGRDAELATLTTMIGPVPEDGTWRPRRFLITGMAGIGKTALAVRAAHVSSALFPDGQLYADLCEPDGTPRDPCAVLVRLLRALGEDDLDEPGDQDDLEELVRRYRTRTAGRRLLILLDNAVGDLQLGPLLPGNPDITVLVTCRTQLARVAGAYTVALGPLDDDSALELLASAAGRSRITADPDASDDLVAYCAGLPLALRITGARLAARPHWPTARLARRLADPETRLAELGYGDLRVRDALLPSVRLLDPRAQTALAGLADLGPEPFSAQAMAEVLGVPEDLAERGLESLVDAALLDISGVDREGRPQYRCHELVWLFAATESGALDTAPVHAL